MFISDKLAYLELQKTGGSHILKLLNANIAGEQSGKHNRAGDELNGKFVLGSIRNPWDWYVSLWAYGCSGQGSIRRLTTRKNLDLDYLRNVLPASMGKKSLSLGETFRTLMAELKKDVGFWQRVYSDASNPVLFRDWLQRLLNKEHALEFGEGYGFSPISTHSGLLTYRYFRLYTSGAAVYTDSNLYSRGALSAFEKSHLMLNYAIRMESLEKDLLAALAHAGVELPPETQQEMLEQANNKTNASKRKNMEHYYDEACIKLVAEKDAFIIEKYDYQPPVI